MDARNNMVTFGYTCDWHLTPRRPIKRIDEKFFTSQLIKIDSLIDTWIKEKVDFAVHGGDLYDVPALPDFGWLNMLIPRLKRLQVAGIPLYITLGSHDVYGYNFDSLERTAVGSLIEYGLIELLHGPKTIQGLNFFGIPGMLNHSTDAYKSIAPETFIVSHNVIVPASVPYPHVLFSDLKFLHKCKFLCAHYHRVFSEKNHTNLFFNPGPLVRTDKSEASHSPQTFIFKVNPDNSLKLRKIIVAHETNVFDLTQDAILINSLMQSFSQTKFEFYDLFDLVTQLVKYNKVAPDVEADVLRRLNDAKTSLQI